MTRRLPHSLSEVALRDIWKDSRDRSPTRAGAPGIDRISARDFGSELPANIRLTRRAIQSGNYQFRRLRVAPIPKASGGERIIAIPTVQDRLVQRALLRHLEDDQRFRPTSSISYGFTKGRSLPDAQKRALELRRSLPWVVQSDIIKFFDQIRRGQLKERIRRAIRSKTIAELIERAIDCELDELDTKARSLAIEHDIRRGRGLRQGMPLSPMLSNFLLKDFDRALERAGLSAIRYADDIAIFCADALSCHHALGIVRRNLTELRLDIPELRDDSKTKIVRPTETLEFLGADIKWSADGYELSAPFRRLGRVETNLKTICSVEYCQANKVTLPEVLRTIEASVIGHQRSVSGLIGAAEFISRLSALRTKYSRELLISIIGKNAVKSMSPQRLAVLGLQAFP